MPGKVVDLSERRRTARRLLRKRGRLLGGSTKGILLVLMLSLGALTYGALQHDFRGVGRRGAPGEWVGVAAWSVRVIDGDTVEVAGERLRLKGWDTPEIFGSQKCAAEKELGERARRRGNELIRSATEFRFSRQGSDGRTVSRWKLDGRDYGAALASDGLARRWMFGRQPKPDWCR